MCSVVVKFDYRNVDPEFTDDELHMDLTRGLVNFKSEPGKPNGRQSGFQGRCPKLDRLPNSELRRTLDQGSRVDMTDLGLAEGFELDFRHCNRLQQAGKNQRLYDRAEKAEDFCLVKRQWKPLGKGSTTFTSTTYQVFSQAQPEPSSPRTMPAVMSVQGVELRHWSSLVWELSPSQSLLPQSA